MAYWSEVTWLAEHKLFECVKRFLIEYNVTHVSTAVTWAYRKSQLTTFLNPAFLPLISLGSVLCFSVRYIMFKRRLFVCLIIYSITHLETRCVYKDIFSDLLFWLILQISPYLSFSLYKINPAILKNTKIIVCCLMFCFFYLALSFI